MTRRWTLFFAICVLFASAVNAQLNRTFVASFGNDANDCSRATPCRSFSGAIVKTNAGGEIIVLDSAGYGASLNITQAISVTAPTGIYGGMTPTSGTAITINAPGAVVVLRGLYLNSIGGFVGISATAVGSLHIENCVVTAFQSNGIQFQGSGNLHVTNTICRNNGNSNFGGGIIVSGTDANNHAHATIENSQLYENGSGNFFGNDAGLVARAFSEVTVRHSVAAGNIRGFVAV